MAEPNSDQTHRSQPPKPAEPPAMSFRRFLESVSPNQRTVINEKLSTEGGTTSLEIPPIQLFCDSEECQGMHYFDCKAGSDHIYSTARNHFYTYTCRHCTKSSKTYAVILRATSSKSCLANKFGEVPAFAPHVPARVLKIVGTDQELFLKGRKSESLGHGIAAYAYYRRVVENQKSRLIEQILNVAERIGAPESMIATLKAAMKETQFTNAIDKIKDAIPEVLKISGHNPLTLLHSALSEGLHAETDEFCLKRATSIRIVLAELCDRIGIALKDHSELQAALGDLLNRNKDNAGAKPGGS